MTDSRLREPVAAPPVTGDPGEFAALAGCGLGDCTHREALDLYTRSADPGVAAGLFQAAARTRDRLLGRSPWWSAGISAIAPCDLDPLCTYCTFFTRNEASIGDIVAAARAIVGLGIRHLHLSGGTRLPVPGEPIGGYDRYLVDLVGAIRANVDVEIEVNVGPSLTRSGVRALRELGVAAVTSSLEVLNAELFACYKPGDSLRGRIQLMEICEEEGMPIRSMMLVGLGESEADRIEHLLFLRRFSMLRHLRLSRYLPFPGVAAGGVRCSPWPVARLTAMARLIHPTIDLGLAAGNDADDLALWWMAGGGNQVLGASVSMKDPRGKDDAETRAVRVGERIVVHDRMPRIARYLQEMQLTPTFAPMY